MAEDKIPANQNHAVLPSTYQMSTNIHVDPRPNQPRIDSPMTSNSDYNNIKIKNSPHTLSTAQSHNVKSDSSGPHVLQLTQERKANFGPSGSTLAGLTASTNGLPDSVPKYVSSMPFKKHKGPGGFQFPTGVFLYDFPSTSSSLQPSQQGQLVINQIGTSGTNMLPEKERKRSWCLSTNSVASSSRNPPRSQEVSKNSSLPSFNSSSPSVSYLPRDKMVASNSSLHSTKISSRKLSGSLDSNPMVSSLSVQSGYPDPVELINHVDADELLAKRLQAELDAITVNQNYIEILSHVKTDELLANRLQAKFHTQNAVRVKLPKTNAFPDYSGFPPFKNVSYVPSQVAYSVQPRPQPSGLSQATSAGSSQIAVSSQLSSGFSKATSTGIAVSSQPSSGSSQVISTGPSPVVPSGQKPSGFSQVISSGPSPVVPSDQKPFGFSQIISSGPSPVVPFGQKPSGSSQVISTGPSPVVPSGQKPFGLSQVISTAPSSVVSSGKTPYSFQPFMSSGPSGLVFASKTPNGFSKVVSTDQRPITTDQLGVDVTHLAFSVPSRVGTSYPSVRIKPTTATISIAPRVTTTTNQVREPRNEQTFTSNIAPVNSIDYDKECKICLDVFDGRRRKKILDCKHDFHTSCINLWLKKSRTCPVCRRACPARGTRRW